MSRCWWAPAWWARTWGASSRWRPARSARAPACSRSACATCARSWAAPCRRAPGTGVSLWVAAPALRARGAGRHHAGAPRAQGSVCGWQRLRYVREELGGTMQARPGHRGQGRDATLSAGRWVDCAGGAHTQGSVFRWQCLSFCGDELGGNVQTHRRQGMQPAWEMPQVLHAPIYKSIMNRQRALDNWLGRGHAALLPAGLASAHIWPDAEACRLHVAEHLTLQECTAVSV